MKLKIMTYNIEHMKKIFHKDNTTKKSQRLDVISKTISSINPDLLGIVEASDKIQHHEELIGLLSDKKYKLAKGSLNRGSHDLVFYYRDPFELVSLDQNVSWYDSWIEDIDNDGIQEVCQFERKPLEAEFAIKGTKHTIFVILISTKSKGVFSVHDLITYQHLALANRKKLLAQSKKIRMRLDDLLSQDLTRSIVVLGDFNDEPGLDTYERMLGQGSLDTITGSVYTPQNIFHNTLWHWKGTSKEKDLWTCQFKDKIVMNEEPHRAWLDHILVSPVMLRHDSAIQLVHQSATIVRNSDNTQDSSDHFPVTCEIEFKE